MPRRPNGTGSLRQRGDAWQSQLRTPTGQQVARTWRGVGRRQAERLHAEWVAAVLGHRTGPEGDTLARHVDAWLHVAQFTPTTRAARLASIRRVFPALGHLHLRDVTPALIDRCLADLAARYSASSVSSSRTSLAMALDQAVTWGIVASNPARQIGGRRGRTRSPVRPDRVATTEEIAAIVAHEKHPLSRVLWATLAGTGARVGEVLALQWRHVDFDGAQILVERTITEGGKGVGSTVGATTKTHRARTVVVDADLLGVLRVWRVELAGQDLTLAAADGWVFPSPRGGPISYDTQRWRWLRALAAAGARDTLTIHGIRHWHGSSMLNGGVDPRKVADRLGHSVTETLERYGRWLPQGDRSALDGLPVIHNPGVTSV